MKAYSMDLRERVMADCDAGLGSTEVARKFSVSPAWVRRLKQHRRERGDIRPRTGRGPRKRKIDRQRLKELATQQPDATLRELRDRLGVNATPWAICKVLRELGLTFKKSPCGPRNRIGPTSPPAGPPGG